MNLSQRIDLMSRLSDYILSDDSEWIEAIDRASVENPWFIQEFVQLAVKNIADNYLRKEVLENWARTYDLPRENPNPKTVGIVMAGNIPLVGFHDLLCVFITGHKARIKPSSKDESLLKQIVKILCAWDNQVSDLICLSERLKNCDAYIATGSNNTAGYFDYYFNKYPNIIRRNRTSVAVLTGEETHAELDSLADDVYQYFGLGCRNVTKLYVPHDYDFIPLLRTFDRYHRLIEHRRYKNNYDYDLAIQLLNKKFYMSNSSLLLVEETSPFSPISRVNYEFYSDEKTLLDTLHQSAEIQCVIGHQHKPFGQSQCPSITEYADGVDTVRFLTNL